MDAEVLTELRQHPKRWARVKEFDRPSSASTLAGRIRKGKATGLDSTEWEAAARRDGERSYLYLRYVGDDS